MFDPNPLVAKQMQTFGSMDGMVGGEFGMRLAKLKALAETTAPGA